MLFGILDSASLSKVGEADWFSFPYIRNMSWSFDFAMLVPFIVATICSTFKTVGDLGTCQKINDAEWKRPDMDRITPGILVDGIGGILPGHYRRVRSIYLFKQRGAFRCYRGHQQDYCLCCRWNHHRPSLFPRLSELFIIMPPPVMGATLIFAISFMIIAGLQIIGTRVLDVRRTFILGLAIIFGLSADLMPQLYAAVHPWIKPVFSSSLALGTVTAIVMNSIMRIGISNRCSLVLQPGQHSSNDVFTLHGKTGRYLGSASRRN